MRIFSGLLVAGALAMGAVFGPATSAWAVDPGDVVPIVNPDFESHSGGAWKYYYPDSHFKGWTATGNVHDGYQATNDATGNFDNWFAVFQGTSSSNQLKQTISSLVANSIYTLSFDVRVVGQAINNSLTVGLGSQTYSITEVNAAGDPDILHAFQTITVQFVTSTTTTLDLFFKATTNSFWEYCGEVMKTSIWIDNIVLTYQGDRDKGVPGPVAGAGAPILLAGGYLLWRRRRAVAAAS